MDFIQFLKEQPNFSNNKIKINCPYIHHQGGQITGGEDEWNFDFYTEYYKVFTKKEIADKYALKVNNVIYQDIRGDIIPFFCRKDNMIFMWNSKTNETYAPISEEDLEFCRVSGEAITKEETHNDTNKNYGITEYHILTPEKSKR